MLFKTFNRVLTVFLGVARDFGIERERARLGPGDFPLRDGVLDFLRGVVWREADFPPFLAGLPPVDRARG